MGSKANSPWITRMKCALKDQGVNTHAGAEVEATDPGNL